MVMMGTFFYFRARARGFRAVGSRSIRDPFRHMCLGTTIGMVASDTLLRQSLLNVCTQKWTQK
jgi:hypothetical protein